MLKTEFSGYFAGVGHSVVMDEYHGILSFVSDAAYMKKRIEELTCCMVDGVLTPNWAIRSSSHGTMRASGLASRRNSSARGCMMLIFVNEF